MRRWHIIHLKILTLFIIGKIQIKIRYYIILQSGLNEKVVIQNTEDLDHSSVLVGVQSGTATMANNWQFLIKLAYAYLMV